MAAYLCDADGRIVRANPRVIALWGRAPAGSDRFTAAQALEERDGSPLAKDDSPVARALRTGQMLQDVNYTEVRDDGTPVAVSGTVLPLTDATGAVIGALNILQDVTPQRRADTDRARLAAIIDSSDDAIVSKTLQGVITSWNAGAERIFGYTADEAVGRHISFIIPADRLSEEDDVLSRLRRGQRIDHFETIRRVKDGRLINISLTVSPIRDSDGVIVGASKVARDITDRVRAGEVIAASQQRYQRIFESAGVSLWEEDFTAVRAALEQLRAAGVEDFAAYLSEHPEEIDRLISLVRIVDVNDTTVEMFGAETKEDLLRSLPDVVSAAARHVFTREIVAFWRGETRFSAEATLRTLAGEPIDVVINITFPAPGESVDSVLVSLTDITLRRQIEEALKSSETALRQEITIRETLARVGASLAAELDPDRLVQAVTDAATSLTAAESGAFFYNVVDESGGTSQLRAVTGTHRSPFATFSPSRVTELFGPTFRGEAIVRLEDAAHAPGAVVPAGNLAPGHLPVRSYLAVPVVSRTGEVLGGLFFSHSVPGMFKAQHEQLAAGIAKWAAIALDNARLYRHAQEANRIKDEFLATLSHELRTPLNAVLGWSHLLQTNALPADTQQRAFEAIERNAKAQAQLVDDLLDVSRIVSGRLQMKSADVDLTAVVHSAIDTVRPAITAKGLTLDIDTAQTPMIVIGDADRLRQIFWNLLTNAAKFTPRGGRIRIEFDAHDQTVAVTVRDTGQGIRRDFLPHVFERFRQADSTVSRRYGGLGLGLAIVRHLAEAHGGTVVADSAGEGQGAAFTVRLPTHPGRRRSASTPRQRVATRDLAGVRALLVDDEPDVREVLGVLLERQGASVAQVASAGEALDLLLKGTFDVLLADLGMPDQDGYALIAAVRSLPDAHNRAIPAIAVTAYAGLRERSRALEAGFGWHVSKPVDPDQLVTVVVAAIQSARANRPNSAPLL